MDGGSRSRSWARELGYRIEHEVREGSLNGLEPWLANAIREDRLSPRFVEKLADYAREKAVEYALQGLSEEEIRSRVAQEVNSYARAIVERDRIDVERFSPQLLFPRDLRIFRATALRPRHVGTWINDTDERRVITYWFYFDYDVAPVPMPRPIDDEYEPFTIVLDKRSKKILEYQTRTHWRIVRIDPSIVHHRGGKPVIGFTDLGHTPIPIVDLDRASQILGIPREELIERLELLRNLVGWEDEDKPIKILRNPLKKGRPTPRLMIENVLTKEWFCNKLVEINRKFWVEKKHIGVVKHIDVHVGPSKKKPPRHDPLEYDWLYIG